MDRLGLAGGFALFHQHDLAIFCAARLQHARLVLHLPLEMGQRQDFLRAVSFAIHEQLYRIEVGMHPDGDRFAFPLLPIPMWKEMQHGLRAPPCFVVIKVVLGEAAHVDDAELRVDRRPSVGRGLAAIVEAGPGKAARQPFPRAIKLPPLLGQFRPRRMNRIVGAHPVAQLVSLVDAACADGARGFRTDARLFGVRFMPSVWHIQVVVETHDIERVGKVRMEAFIDR